MNRFLIRIVRFIFSGISFQFLENTSIKLKKQKIQSFQHVYNKMEKKLKIWKNVREREHWCFFHTIRSRGGGNFFIAFTCSFIGRLTTCFILSKKGKTTNVLSQHVRSKGGVNDDLYVCRMVYSNWNCWLHRIFCNWAFNGGASEFYSQSHFRCSERHFNVRCVLVYIFAFYKLQR